MGQIDISFNSNIENTRFDSQIETNLYRIICELFQNTVKHASAGKVSLLVHFHEGRLVVQYFDDGVGFDPGDGTSVNGMGLSNMRSRLKPLNGDIEFKRIMPKGMMTSIMLKLKAKTAAHGKTKYTDC